MFQAQGPDGKTYNIDAPDEQSAQAAFQEMMSQGGQMSGGGGQQSMAGGNGGMSFDDLIPEQNRQQPAPQQGQGGPMTFDDIGQSPQDRFRTAFDKSQDDPALASALDRNVNAEADTRGRFAVAGNAATMGFGDEVMGLLAGGLTFAAGDGFAKGYDTMTSAIRGDIDRYTQRHPVESAAIDIGASIPTAMVGGGAGALGKAPLAMKMLRGAVGGAAYGGTRGFAEGRGGVDQRVESAGTGAAVGGAVGAAVPAIARGVGKVAGKVAGRKAAPSNEAVKTAADALYQKADQAGVMVRQVGLRRASMVGNSVRNRLRPQLHPNAIDALKVVDDMSKGGSLSLRDVETTRQVLSDAVSSAKPGSPDERMAYKVLNAFDDWVDQLKPRDFMNGKVTGKEAVQLYNEARTMWGMKKKGDDLARIVRRAEAQSLDDPSKFPAKLRQYVQTFVANEKRLRGYTDAEVKALKKIAKGGDMGWLLKAIDKASPGMSLGRAAQSAAWGVGAATGIVPAPLAIGAAGLGVAARAGRSAGTKRAAQTAAATINNAGRVPFSDAAARAGEDAANALIGGGGQATGGYLTRR